MTVARNASEIMRQRSGDGSSRHARSIHARSTRTASWIRTRGTVTSTHILPGGVESFVPARSSETGVHGPACGTRTRTLTFVHRQEFLADAQLLVLVPGIGQQVQAVSYRATP